MANQPKHEVYLNEKGEVEYLDLETGEVFRKEIAITELADYIKVGNRWVPASQAERPLQYNSVIATAIADDILNGGKLTPTLAKHKVPYRTYCNWRKKFQEFDDMMVQARRDRAEVFFEKIEEEAERAGADPDEVGLARMRIEAYKHLSSVLDQRFSQKQVHTGTIGVVPISIETGIRRPGDDGYQEKDVLGQIEEGQKRLAAVEAEQFTPAKRAHVSGLPVSEEVLDGKKDN